MIELIRTILSTILKGKNWIEKLPKSYIFLTSRYHWYNMVSPSPWPILIGITSFPGVIGLVGTMHGLINGLELFISSFVTFLFFFCMWNRDIIRESTFIGLHTKQVDKNTITGFKLFLFSEIMLFVTFFWAHLYSALYPSVFIGLSWPPVGLSHLLLDPFDIPWTNTLILVYSGLTVTVSHLYLRRGNMWLSGWAMFATIVLGLAFLYIQKEEFVNSEFDISDGIYGSTFFMLTGFHGGHVIIGVTGLIITLIRLIELHFSSYSHTGFKLALIYWHFVDVVWIFVFLIVYVLGSDLTFFNAVFTIGDVGEKPQHCIINLEAATFGKYSKVGDLFPFQFNFGGSGFSKDGKFDLMFLNNKKSQSNFFFMEQGSLSLRNYKYYLLNDQNLINPDDFRSHLSFDNTLMEPELFSVFEFKLRNYLKNQMLQARIDNNFYFTARPSKYEIRNLFSICFGIPLPTKPGFEIDSTSSSDITGIKNNCATMEGIRNDGCFIVDNKILKVNKCTTISNDNDIDDKYFQKLLHLSPSDKTPKLQHPADGATHSNFTKDDINKVADIIKVDRTKNDQNYHPYNWDDVIANLYADNIKFYNYDAECIAVCSLDQDGNKYLTTVQDANMRIANRTIICQDGEKIKLYPTEMEYYQTPPKVAGQDNCNC